MLLADLEARVTPRLVSPDALQAANMIGDMFAYLAAWHDGESEALAGYAAAMAAIAPPGSEPDLASEFPVGGEAFGLAAEALQDKIEAGDQPDASLLRCAIETEGAALVDEPRRVSAVRRIAAEKQALVEVAMTAERALALVDACLGPGHEVLAVSRVAGGFSKDSFFLSVRAPQGLQEEMVIRRDLPFGPGENTVADEYGLLQRLGQLGFPVAEPLGCDRGRIVGQPAMLSRRVSGSSGTAPWDADPDARQRTCFGMADALAWLHQLEPAQGGLSAVSADPREQLLNYVLEWRERWRRNRVHPSPTLAAGFEWLVRNLPDRIDRLSIVHGDVGFHNAIVRDGELAALLDWEFAHLGDSTEDLSYCRPVIQALVPWEDFLARYRAAGGAPYREENARFFELWRSVRNAVCCAVSWRGFVGGAYPALKMAYQGIPLYRTFVHNIAVSLQERA